MSHMKELIPETAPTAVLDEAHIGDIRGALGTIRHGDTAARTSWGARFRTLLAILGPGLIVMVGDNDAGAFGTYTQAGQNYGTSLLWTLLLLVPVLYGAAAFSVAIASGFAGRAGSAHMPLERRLRDLWRMPPLQALPPARLSTLSRIWMIVLRVYLILAGGLVLVRIIMLAANGG
jgi:hypothetical protein